MAQQDNEKVMKFFDHLDELRQRVMTSLYVFGAGFLLSYFIFTEKILAFLRAPLFKIMPLEQQKLYFTSLFENFMVHLKISAVASLFLFSPFFFFQIWAFVSPGLHERERKSLLPFVASATTFFFGGAAFAYYVLFPTAFRFFLQFGAATDVPLLTIDSYYSTCLKLMLLFGLAFELPVITVLLGFLGVIDAPFLRLHRRNFIIGITFACALFAPPDAISMVILMIPLILFFEGSIFVVAWVGKRSKPVDHPS